MVSKAEPEPICRVYIYNTPSSNHTHTIGINLSSVVSAFKVMSRQPDKISVYHDKLIHFLNKKVLTV